MNPKSSLIKAILAASLAATLAVLSACIPTNAPYDPLPTEQGSHPVDPQFRALYDHLGGEEMLGPAISPVIEHNGYKLQYTFAALLYHNPQLAEDPIGLLNLANIIQIEKIGQSPSEVHPEFLPLYEEMGARFVGKPINPAFYNTEHERLEQHFENVGFYRRTDLADAPVQLLGYGYAVCREICAPTAGSQDFIPSGRYGDVPEPFASALLEYGLDLVGEPLTEPYAAPDGRQEMIFTNMVLAEDPANPRQARPRAMVESLGYARQPLVKPMLDERMVFVPVQDGMGFNVPRIFLDYLSPSGGLETAGLPLAEMQVAPGDLYRQCFSNLCLTYDHNAPEGMKIRPLPLGMTYRTRIGSPAPSSDNIPQPVPPRISLKVWETHPLLPDNVNQEIHVLVTDERSQPQANVTLVLTLTLPDGSEREMQMMPTGPSGRSYQPLPVIHGEKSTIIPFTVCTRSTPGEPICVKESFTLWW